MGRTSITPTRLAAGFTLTGAALVVVGVAFISFPAALIVAGVALVAAGLLSEVE